MEAFKISVKSRGIIGENEYDLTGIYCVDELPECEISLPDWLEQSKYPRLCEVDMYALDQQKVDIVLGAYFAGLMIPIEVKCDTTNINSLTGIKTHLGWTIQGKKHHC